MAASEGHWGGLSPGWHTHCRGSPLATHGGDVSLGLERTRSCFSRPPVLDLIPQFGRLKVALGSPVAGHLKSHRNPAWSILKPPNPEVILLNMARGLGSTLHGPPGTPRSTSGWGLGTPEGSSKLQGSKDNLCWPHTPWVPPCQDRACCPGLVPAAISRGHDFRCNW